MLGWEGGSGVNSATALPFFSHLFKFQVFRDLLADEIWRPLECFVVPSWREICIDSDLIEVLLGSRCDEILRSFK